MSAVALALAHHAPPPSALSGPGDPPSSDCSCLVVGAVALVVGLAGGAAAMHLSMRKKEPSLADLKRQLAYHDRERYRKVSYEAIPHHDAAERLRKQIAAMERR